MAISCFSVLAVILASLGVLFSVIFSISLVGVNVYNGIISAINFVKVIPLYHSETPSTIIPSLYFGFTIIISLLTLYTAFKAGKSKGKTDEETNSQCSTPTSPRYTKDSEDDTYFNHRSTHHHLMNKNVICLVTLQLAWAATGNAMLNLEDIFPGNILESIHHTVYLLWVNLAALFISASAIMLSSLFFLLGSDKKERSPLLP